MKLAFLIGAAFGVARYGGATGRGYVAGVMSIALWLAM